MGVQSSSTRDSINIGEDVNFDHFQILRAIGKGSFGKVCIVQKKDTKQMYAMKYMHKSQCIERDALKNVLREMQILTTLEHPFLVNLWFCFQDEEDLFMVNDLLLGGDLRYHITQDVKFTQESIHLYAYELGLALDYLKTKHIIHRDIKPDNILLDEEGHVHITDFNIASVIEENQLATSMSGTKPYIAPEIFLCALDECVGYSYAVDWWSLGVTLYEILARTRPFDIHSSTSIKDIKTIINSPVKYPSAWSDDTKQLISQLLCVDPNQRLSNAVALTKLSCIQKYNVDAVLEKQIGPGFTPPRDHLNCDPTFELEEMIVEARPLHKKKKRLAKQRSLKQSSSFDIQDVDLEDQLSDFKVYNRERELIRKAMEKKENDWEAELIQAMNESTVSCEVIKPSSNSENASEETNLLNIPSSILLDQRRRSSCKLSVSPLSVHTRLAASPQRKEIKQSFNDTINKPKKKILYRQQTLQRLPYINVNEIITIDKDKLKEENKIDDIITREECHPKGTNKLKIEGKIDKTIREENQEIHDESIKGKGEQTCGIENVLTQQCDKELFSDLRTENVEHAEMTKEVKSKEGKEFESHEQIQGKEIELNANEIIGANSTIITGFDKKTTKENLNVLNEKRTVNETNVIMKETDKENSDNSYNYELTRFKVTKTVNKNNLSHLNEMEQHSHVKEGIQDQNSCVIYETDGDNIDRKLDQVKTTIVEEKSKIGVLQIAVENIAASANMNSSRTKSQTKGSNEKEENNNVESEQTKITFPSEQNKVIKNEESLKGKQSLNLPNISISTEKNDKTITTTKKDSDIPKSPLKSPNLESSRSNSRSPLRSPKLGDIPTRSVLKNSLYRTDSTDSTKSLEKSPKKSYKVSFSCDVEDNVSVRPKSPNSVKLQNNSKSLDNDGSKLKNK